MQYIDITCKPLWEVFVAEGHRNFPDKKGRATPVSVYFLKTTSSVHRDSNINIQIMAGISKLVITLFYYALDTLNAKQGWFSIREENIKRLTKTTCRITIQIQQCLTMRITITNIILYTIAKIRNEINVL